MQIGGKEYKVGQRIRIINAKSVDHSLPHCVH